jgi:hypothetical protein
LATASTFLESIIMNESLQIFLHGAGAPQDHTASATDTLGSFLARLGGLPASDQFVFVGQGAAADDDRDDDADEDAHAPADLALTLADLGIVHRGHVHTRAVRQIAVTVYFNGKDVHRRFSPAAMVARVTAWAKRKLKLDPQGSADLVLALKPSNDQPRPDQHLGELLIPGTCALEFDLVREITPQG